MRWRETARAALVLSGIYFCCGSAAAQQASVELRVDKQIARVGEPITVDVTIVTEGSDGYETYEPPSFSGFRVGPGGSTSQNIEMINWNVRRREQRRYVIFAESEGERQIGPAQITINGRQVRSAKAKVVIRAADAAGSIPAAPDENDLGGSGIVPAPDAREQGIAIRASVSKERAYIGEQVVVEWLLLTQYDIMGFRPKAQPTTKGAWTEELETPRRLSFSRQIVDGEEYAVAVLDRRAFFPKEAGVLKVTPYEARMRVLSGFSMAVVERRSSPVEIKVLPLPEGQMPADFPRANVGHFEFAATLDRNRVRRGDALTLRLVIRGAGNLAQVTLPSLESLPGFKMYEPNVSLQLTRDEQLSGERTVEILFGCRGRGRTDNTGYSL